MRSLDREATLPFHQPGRHSMTRRLFGSVLLSLGAGSTLAAQQMTTRDLFALPQPAPDSVIAYGTDSLQFGELFRPTGVRRSPVAILIHGGCWVAQIDGKHIRSLARALADLGVTVWSIEYRRVGHPGAGWPGTFEDVAAGVDYVRQLAGALDLDTTRVVVAGHSAGGHFALWVGARSKLPAGAPGASAPFRPKAVLGISPVPDLTVIAAQPQPVCGPAVNRLIGGSLAEQPERYRLASPAKLVPLGVEQVLLVGAADPVTPADWSRSYFDLATKAGDQVKLRVVPNAGHFEVVAPATAAGKEVIATIRALVR
jgi:acetyl esterase/lipase